MGCFQALGFADLTIARVYLYLTIALSASAALTGMLFGWMLSGVLLDAYTASYGISDVKKGIQTSSFFIGVIPVILAAGLTTAHSCKVFFKKEPALLIKGTLRRKESALLVRIADRISAAMPESKRFPVRIVFRKPATLVLSVIAVGVSVTLFIMSISLYLSSNKVYESQTNGRHYSFDVKLNALGQDVGAYAGSVLYLETSASVMTSNRKEPVRQQLIGLTDGGDLLTLYNQNGQRLSKPQGNEIWIGPGLEEIYGVKKGDTVTLNVSNKRYSAIVSDVAANAESNRIYMNKEQLAEWMNVEKSSYNGLLSNDVHSVPSGRVITEEERLFALDKAAVSNRMSAVINQLLGCIAGGILIYLVLLLNFQDSTREILILSLLGYRPKEINNMLIGVFGPIIAAAFLLMLYPGIVICRQIQRSLSMQTGDYMPFQTNVFIVVAIFVVMQIIYAVAKAAFTAKIRTIIRKETIHAHMQ
ncbi:hypothetical protein XI25_10630 [Paenibacillus sp. DMB20]|nr:hypothetical protein XI25_10630 [Paenibacillus sp. DMB20]